MVADTVLRELALLPTARLVERPQAFWLSLTDADVMRVAVLLAQKSFDEGGCPIGAVIVDRATRRPTPLPDKLRVALERIECKP